MSMHVSFLRKSLVQVAVFFAALGALVYGPVLFYTVSPGFLRSIGFVESSLGNSLFPGIYAILSLLNTVSASIIASELHRMWIISLQLHVICSVLVFSAVALLASWHDKESFIGRHALGISFLAGLLFLLHPVQSWAVLHMPWGQKELAISTLVLGILNIFLLYTRGLARIPILLLGIIAALLLCGAWEVAFILPALLLTVDWLFIARGNAVDLKERLGIHLGLVVLAVVPFAYLISIAFGNGALYGLNDLIAMGQQASIFFFGHLASLIWPFSIIGSLLVHVLPMWLAPLAALLLFSVVVAWEMRTTNSLAKPFALCVAAFFFASFLRPCAAGPFYLAAESGRYLGSFAGMFALACLLVWLAEALALRLNWITEHLATPVSRYAALSAALLLPVGIYTSKRVSAWQTETSFWADVVARAPEHAESHLNYGFALLRERSVFQPVAEKFGRVVEIAPDNVKGYTGLAACHVRNGRLDEAITVLSDAVRLSPRSLELYASLASLLIRTKRFDAGERLLKTALRVEPREVAIWASLVRLHLTKGEHEKAQVALKSACIELDVRDRSLLDLFGRLSVATKRYEDAEVAFRNLLVQTPGNNDAMVGRAHALQMLKRYDEAIGVYDEVLHGEPNHKVATRGLAETYYLSGRTAEAIPVFAKARAFAELASWANLRIAACHERLGERDKACEVVEELLRTPVNERIKSVAEEYLAMLRAPQALQVSA